MGKVRLFFAGDFCSKPTTSFINVSDELKAVVQSCDVKSVNFEVPLNPQVELPHQKWERFFQHDDAPSFLKEIGFNLFPIATNHTFDWGEKGFEKTKSALGDSCFGAGLYDEAYRVKIVEVQGVKVGFLALTYAAYKGVFDDVINHDGFGCAYINDLKVNHIIIEAKQCVDYLFILAHDGIEYIDIPTPEIVARYRDFIDYGADGVIGTHPHCPQGWEIYRGKLIFYSLGNFFFNSKEDTLYRADNRPHWYEGMCVVITLDGGDISFEVVNTRNIDNVEIVLDKDPSRDIHNQKLCSYLSNMDDYKEYLDIVTKRLNLMRIIDTTVHTNSIKKTAKALWSAFLIKLKRGNVDDFSLRTLMRNDTRRSVLLRSMRLR